MFSNLEGLHNHQLLDRKLSLLKNNSLESNSPHKICFNFHKIPFVLYSTSETIINELREHLPPIWIREDEQGIRIFHDTPPIADELWDQESSQDCYISDNRSFIIQRDFAAQIISKDEYKLYAHASLKEDGIFNFFRWLLPSYLIAKNQFLFHCSAVLGKSDCAHVFLGHSGAGKSTVCELAGQRRIINDDMNIMLLDQNKATIRSGGIGGAFPTTPELLEKEFDIKAIYWILQSNKNELIQLPPSKGITKAMASFANLHWSHIEKDFSENLLTTAEKLSSLIPFYEMHFLKTPAIWEIIDP